MPRAVYSSVIAAANSISAPALVATVPAGYTYVIRHVGMTYGSFAGYVRGYALRNNVNPRLLGIQSGAAAFIGTEKQTADWEGRVVLEQGDELWLGLDSGDTADFYVSGYVLTNT
jgi:hypothetical protein